ncbi:MAG: hypothetical protein Q7T05_00020, partial [Dehalococcoidia bacterium]|nr:hypothetical protein [Dehalococcoidia bacterium]
MKEICGEKRLEVANRYLLGRSYGEIEAETGTSHGTIANIIQELESGKLIIPGTPFDQINDLRTLSLDLKKKGMQPSQALLGLSMFQRLQDLEITPERLDGWADLLKGFAQPDLSPKNFLAVALRLHGLEKSQVKSFEILADEFLKLGDDVAK